MGYSWTFPISVDGYLFQLNSQKPWSDLFSSFSFTSSANTVNPYLQINSESRPLSPPWLLTTPEQATVVSHQDTCCHLLPGLCASSSLLWSTLDSTYEWPMPHCSSVENPLLPISLQKTSLQLCTHPGNSSLCPHCFLFSHLTQTARHSRSLDFRHASEPLHLLSPLPGMFCPLPHTCWLALFKYPLIREKPSLRTLHEIATHPVSSLSFPFTLLYMSS